jgi:two-component system chemotaxis sensor kinase CheA
MTLDLSQFRGIFFEECFESLDGMEAALLKLSVGETNPDLINTIFRGAHSIKGGSATFGFSAIAGFTHRLESLLDEIRSGKTAVTAALVDVLLKSVDVLRTMLKQEQDNRPGGADASPFDLEKEIAVARESGAGSTTASSGATSSSAPTAAVLAAPTAVVPPAPAAATPLAVASVPATVVTDPASGASSMRRWRIGFRPHESLLMRGNDPLTMISELRDLGALEIRADAHKLPRLADMNPEHCYLAWELLLESDVAEATIRKVFEWADGDCDLTVETADSEAPAATLQPAPATATQALPVSAEASTPAARTAGSAPVPAPSKSEASAHASPDSSSIRVSVEKIDELMNTVGELVITQAMLSQLANQLDGPSSEPLRVGLAQLERNMRELQESVMRVRMLPISFVFSRFPRMVRDLAHRLEKQIELKLTGEHTELDKTVLEKIGDPLVHLVRNSVDHGIEMPDVRVAAGKSATGTVHLDASHKGGSITIAVRDDGGGLNRDRILAKARERGLVGTNDVLTDAQIYDLIFLPGFSTVAQATDLSGRGVGMDVVRRNVKALGGSIDVRSRLGEGSQFVIKLPLTLAIVDGQTVAVGSETYIIPLVSIVESLQLKPEMVNRVSASHEVFWFRDAYLPVVRLHQIFGVEPRARTLNEGLVMVVEGDGRRVGLFVDDLLGQQQVVIKSLDANYGRIEGVSGATILGDGSVALILDLPGLIHSASPRVAA